MTPQIVTHTQIVTTFLPSRKSHYLGKLTISRDTLNFFYYLAKNTHFITFEKFCNAGMNFAGKTFSEPEKKILGKLSKIETKFLAVRISGEKFMSSHSPSIVHHDVIP